MRLAAVWLLLFAAYAATLGIPATADERHAGDEPHHLLAAQSLVQDGDFDLANQYFQREWEAFRSAPLAPSGKLTQGRLHEPQGLGMPLAIAPAYALGGARSVELLIAAIAALGFALAVPLAHRLVPEPWATAGVLVAGASPPALASATTVAPEPVAGALLAGAALCALKVRERSRLRYAFGGALMVALLPWLDLPVTLAGLPVGYCLVRWTLGERRRLAALVAAELMTGSLVFFAALSETFHGGPAPAFARIGGAAPDGAAGYLERADNVVLLWLDPGAGLLRWAPVLALVFAGGWLLLRSRREHVAAVIPERREAERAGALLLAVVAGGWVGAAFATEAADGPWFPGVPMAATLPAASPLAAWGLRHARLAGAALAALTLLLSGWALADAWLGPAEGWIGVAR